MIRPECCPGERPRRLFRSRSLAASLIAGAAIVFHILPAHAQPALPAWQPKAPQYVQCPAPGQPLPRIPELISQNGKLRATIMLNNNVQRMFPGATDRSQCLPEDVRQFRGVNATLPAYGACQHQGGYLVAAAFLTAPAPRDLAGEAAPLSRGLSVRAPRWPSRQSPARLSYHRPGDMMCSITPEADKSLIRLRWLSSPSFDAKMIHRVTSIERC